MVPPDRNHPHPRYPLSFPTNEGGYLGVAYITRATIGIYVYSFLNPDKGGIVAAYIVGIFVGALLIFAIVNGVAWALKRTTRAKADADLSTV
jgi:hypothetical protein